MDKAEAQKRIYNPMEDPLISTKLKNRKDMGGTALVVGVLFSP